MEKEKVRHKSQKRRKNPNTKHGTTTLALSVSLVTTRSCSRLQTVRVRSIS